MKVSSFITNKVVKNASWIIVGKMFQMALAFIVGILTARYLGPSNYGLINYAAAYITFFASFCTLGINSIIIKNFVDYPEEKGEALGTAIVLRSISSIISSAMIIGIVYFVDTDEHLTIIVVALSTIALLFQSFEVINYWFQEKLQSKYTTYATVTAYTIVSAYKIILLIKGMDVTWFAVATAIDYIVVAAILIALYKKKGGEKFSFSVRKVKQLLGKSKSFILAGMMVSIYNCTDRLMLKQMLDVESVGYYALAVSISTIWCFVLSAIIDSMYPGIMNLYKCNKADYIKKNRQLYSIVFYLSISVSLIITLFAEFIINVLYGVEYIAAANPLRIVIWYTAFSYLGVARNAWIVCENKQKYLKYIYISAAFINVLLNYIFIPVWGASGAAIASLITQAATVLIVPYFIKDLKENTILIFEAIRLKNIR